ncbi:hypothetical protein J4457_05355 [Candidatus Woesearchaeota archaeon]|nr:hypothetical protein [Candidatus Woesearchaeota archaeon]
MDEKGTTKTVALATGTVFAVLHALGVIALQLGAWDYIKWVHMFEMPLTIQPFDVLPFVLGIVTVFVVGCFVGWLFSVAYYYFEKR